jgi:hypothetical protein
LSYETLATALNKLSESYKVETAGLLKEGRLCFLSLRGEDWDVVGDEMRSYFVTNLSLQPGIGHRVFHTPVRVVCWNTNTMAIGRSTINVSISHHQDSIDQLKIAADLVARFRSVREEAKSVFEKFAGRTVTVKEAQAIFEEAYPMPSPPKKLAMIRNVMNDQEIEVLKRKLAPGALKSLEQAEVLYEAAERHAKERRDTVWERYEAFQPNKLRGTLWAAYNAVTEVSDWRKGKSAAVSCLWGTRAAEKSRAFSAGLALVG